MNIMSSDFCRTQAANFAEEARKATRPDVRERKLRSEAAWTAMAERAATYEDRIERRA